jgi:hypothetical protein
MGSWSRWPRTLAALGASAVLLASVVGCSTSAASPGDGLGPFATGVHPASANPSASALASGGTSTVNSITARFDYRDRMITPLAHLYGKFLDDFVIATVKNDNSTSVRVVVTSDIPNFTSPATDTVTIDAGATKEIRQNPRLTTTAINNLNSEKQADLHVVVSYLDNGQPRTVLDQTATTTITSRRDFPWKIEGMTDTQDYELLAAMITPTDPKVEELIRTAANYDPRHVMTSGYTKANDSDKSVLQRLSNIWQAETTDYHLTYISTTETFDASSQRIRLPNEVLTSGSGNCIETSLLYAAVAEALGMQPVIIIVPGHAYMGVNLDGQGDSWYFIETTMIGRYAFADAVAEGNTEWATAAPHEQAGEAQYGFMNVQKARTDGVTPIPWN